MNTCSNVEKVRHRIAEIKKRLKDIKSVISICRWLSTRKSVNVTATHNAPIKCVQMFTVSLWIDAIEIKHSRTELAGGRCFCRRKWLSPSHSSRRDENRSKCQNVCYARSIDNAKDHDLWTTSCEENETCIWTNLVNPNARCNVDEGHFRWTVPVLVAFAKVVVRLDPDPSVQCHNARIVCLVLLVSNKRNLVPVVSSLAHADNRSRLPNDVEDENDDDENGADGGGDDDDLCHPRAVVRFHLRPLESFRLESASCIWLRFNQMQKGRKVVWIKLFCYSCLLCVYVNMKSRAKKKKRSLLFLTGQLKKNDGLVESMGQSNSSSKERIEFDLLDDK